MPRRLKILASLTAGLIGLANLTGCHSNQNVMPNFWGTATRVPPPTTNSYGKAASYYGQNPTTGAPPPGIPGTNLPPPPGAPLQPPPPSVPATGARPPATLGASSDAWPSGYSVTPATPLPTVPPTYLSSPARVDTMIQPASSQTWPPATPLSPASDDRPNDASGSYGGVSYGNPPAPTSASPTPANNLRWGLR